MKKAALKGLAVLAGVVLFCLFFSGTVHTLTTAKVRLTSARTGKLEEEISLTGTLSWGNTRDVRLSSLTSSDTLLIKRFDVTVGQYVLEGAPLLECELSEYDSRMEALGTEYSSKEAEYLELERKNSGTVLTRQQENWFECYEQLKTARSGERDARIELRVAAQQKGIELNGDALPADAKDDELTALAQKLALAKAEARTAEESFERVNRFEMSDDLVSYVEKKQSLEEEMEKLTEDMTRLQLLREQVKQIASPYTGYVASVELKSGDTLTSGTTVLTMTEENAGPVLRADIGSVKRTIEIGNKVTIQGKSGTVSREVTDIGVSTDGVKYIDVSVSDDDIANLGGMSYLSAGNVEMKLVYKAASSTTLIPASAVHGTNDERYVYTVETAQNALGAQKMTVSKQSITVIAETSSVVSVSENLSGTQIAYMEDRTLTDGCEVLTYSE